MRVVGNDRVDGGKIDNRIADGHIAPVDHRRQTAVTVDQHLSGMEIAVHESVSSRHQARRVVQDLVDRAPIAERATVQQFGQSFVGSGSPLRDVGAIQRIETDNDLGIPLCRDDPPPARKRGPRPKAATRRENAGRPRRSRGLVPWNRDELPKSRSGAPGSQGATTENIGHIQGRRNAARR